MSTTFMTSPKYLFTSESVSEGHPDKMCDQISDAILDAILVKDPMARVACEVATTTGLIVVMGEITTSAYIDIEQIARDTIREIGYTRSDYGFDAETYRFHHTHTHTHTYSLSIFHRSDSETNWQY